jgi:hypothetical protein
MSSEAQRQTDSGIADVLTGSSSNWEGKIVLEASAGNRVLSLIPAGVCAAQQEI